VSRDASAASRRPDVSVVIPVHNAEATIGRCLAGLADQTVPRDRYEVIVVDNNSRDASLAIARSVPGVTVIEEPRQGAYAARNRGLRIAQGEVVLFTDPDCVPDRDWLEAALAAVADGTVVAVGATLQTGSSPLLEVLLAYASAKDEYSFGSSDPELYYGRTNNMAVLRSVFTAVGPFVEQPRGADNLLVRAAVARYGPERVRFEPRMRVRHAEYDGIGSYLRKLHIYGYASRTFGTAPPRSLSVSEWAALVRETRRRTRWAWAAPALVALTAATRLSWRLGKWRAAAGLRPPRGTVPVDAHAAT
jgi:glycosyltransferase involved in cell wall biosynthesis